MFSVESWEVVIIGIVGGIICLYYLMKFLKGEKYF